jgi:3-hydroxyisobutyrate dehydrogenase
MRTALQDKEQSMQRVTLLGLGAMGSRVAHSLLRAGFPLTVFNRSSESAATLGAAGAVVAGSPREAVVDADIVMSMVRDDAASQSVWLDAETGALGALRPAAVAVELSTLTPAWVTALGGHVAATGATLIDAPVVGTRPQAEARQLIVLVGGDAEALARARPALAAIGQAVHRIGPLGTASALKLAANTLYGVQVAAWAEMLALLNRQGITSSAAIEALSMLPMTSPAMQVAGRLMATRSYAPLFPIDLVDKDFGAAQAWAEGLGGRSPVLTVVRAIYAEARARGYGSDNIVGVQQLYDQPSSATSPVLYDPTIDGNETSRSAELV